jgi:Zn-dependent protease
MNKGIKLVKLFGITIKLDWSWLLILVLTIWNLTTTFNQLHQDWELSFTVMIATAAALLFFLSVLLHELAHSLVARAQGIPVNSITLFLFGGVSNIREEPKSPGSEFLMAILGPVTSLLIGFILLMAAGVGVKFDSLNTLNPQDYLQNIGAGQTLVIWLGSINFMLGLFNLIPGFPLDGGRVLRSILWAITRNLKKATRWASYVGQAIAWAMIISGIGMVFGAQIPLLGQGLGSGVWIVFIGWFLNNAASRSYQRMLMRDMLEDVPVVKLARRDPPTVPADISVDTLIEDYIMQTDEHAFPVMTEGDLQGIVCLEDVRAVPKAERATTRAADIMTPRPDLISAQPQEDAYQVLEKLAQHDIRQLLVLDGEALVGMVRRRDIVRYLQIQSDAF